MPSPVSIGVMFRREQPPDRLIDYARRVEVAGFDELWVVEDCFYTAGIAQASTALAVTDRITVGLGIAPAMARNPAFLAMEFATLARLQPGRFHGGIGHGVAAWMEQIGAKPTSWLAAIEETTTAVRALLRGERLTTEGRCVRLRDVQLEHIPETPPPVSLGVQGPRSLRLSGRCADGTILAETSGPAYVSWARERIAEGRAGRATGDPHRLTAYAFCDVDAPAVPSARSSVRLALAPFLSGGSASAQVRALPYAAEVDALIAESGMHALRERMPDSWIDDLAIAGSPAQCTAAIERLSAAGADAVVLVPPPALDAGAWLDRVAELLLPLLRGAA